MGLRLQRAVAAGLALGLAGCGPRIEGPIEGEDDSAGKGDAGDEDDADGAVTATSGDGAEADGGEAEADGGEAEADDGSGEAEGGDSGGGDGDDGVLFDVGTVPPDPPGPTGECFEAPPLDPTCDVEVPDGLFLGYLCVPQAEQFTCDANTDEDAIFEAQSCLQCSGAVESVACGPVSSGVDSCCYWFLYWEGQTCPGRPFTVGGESRLPRVVPRSDWLARVSPRVDHLDTATREALARAWAEEGCFEAASVASFSRFAVQLLVLGAPPDLLAATQRAAAEEIRHARAMFGLASAYGGRDVGPGELDVLGGFDDANDPVHIAESLAAEGCIAETISAHQLAVAAARAKDPTVRRILQEIAEEELQHAELAWRALGWMLQRGDDPLRARVADCFGRAIESVPQGTAATDELDESLARACGRLPHADRLALASSALRELVAPAAAALLAPWTTLDVPEHVRGALS